MPKNTLLENPDHLLGQTQQVPSYPINRHNRLAGGLKVKEVHSFDWKTDRQPGVTVLKPEMAAGKMAVGHLLMRDALRLKEEARHEALHNYKPN